MKARYTTEVVGENFPPYVCDIREEQQIDED